MSCYFVKCGTSYVIPVPKLANPSSAILYRNGRGITIARFWVTSFFNGPHRQPHQDLRQFDLKFNGNVNVITTCKVSMQGNVGTYMYTNPPHICPILAIVYMYIDG